jgi:hypothetical protein
MVYLWCLCGVKSFLPFSTSFYKKKPEGKVMSIAVKLAGEFFLFIGLVLNLAFGLELRT